MARPKKSEDHLKTHMFTIRFDDVQYSILCEYAKLAGLSKTDYIRKQVVTGKVDVEYRIVADLPKLQELTKELSAIGRNLNQIAKYFNSGGLQTSEIRDEITRSINGIMDIRDAVMEIAGRIDGNPKTYRK